MLHTIAQIALGICYGLCLAILAPTSQRQKAYELLTQHAVVPTLQEKPKQSLAVAAVVESTAQSAVDPDLMEDPWLAKLSPSATENQVTAKTIAVFPPAPKLLLLSPAQLDSQQTVKASSRRKTKAPKTKRAKTKVQVSDTVTTALSKTTVA